MSGLGRTRFRPTQGRQELAVKAIALGAPLALLPLLVSSLPFGRAFSGLIPFGVLFLVAGVAFFLWIRQAQAGAKSAVSATEVTASSGHDKAKDALSEELLAKSRPARASTSGADPHKTFVAVARTLPVSPPVGADASNVEPAIGSPTRAPSAFGVARYRPTVKSSQTTPDSPPVRPTSWGADVFNVIEWRRFEALVETLFKQAGFETKSQSRGADEGIDLWLYSSVRPGTPVGLVQCKRWYAGPVGVDKIRQLHAVMAAKNIQRGLFATTSAFTPDAMAFATDNGIDLLGVDKLLEMIAKRSPKEQQALLKIALEGAFWKPTCVKCGIKMIARTSSKDGSAFWGCSNFPRCKTTMPMRAH